MPDIFISRAERKQGLIKIPSYTNIKRQQMGRLGHSSRLRNLVTGSSFFLFLHKVIFVAINIAGANGNIGVYIKDLFDFIPTNTCTVSR